MVLVPQVVAEVAVVVVVAFSVNSIFKICGERMVVSSATVIRCYPIETYIIIIRY